jgi:hypothetical protein
MPERYNLMHSTGGTKNDSLETRASAARPAAGHDSDPSTIETPTTDLLPLLSEAHTARVESEFEDVPEVIAEIPSSPPQRLFGGVNEADDTITGVITIDTWKSDSPFTNSILYEPDVIELDEEDLPELVAPDPVEFVPSSLSSVKAVSDHSHSIEPAPLWLDMVEEVVELIGEMEEDASQLRVDQPDSAEICRHVAVRLTLMLARNGVTVIGIKEQGAVETIMGQTFDRARHQPATIDTPARGARIIEVVSPGFAVGQRVLRRARVRCQ